MREIKVGNVYKHFKNKYYILTNNYTAKPSYCQLKSGQENLDRKIQGIGGLSSKDSLVFGAEKVKTHIIIKVIGPPAAAARKVPKN